jgi:hypothetical protein
MATAKKLTPVKRKPAPVADSDIDESLATTKVKSRAKPKADTVGQAEVLEELKKQTEYLHRVDWKLWMLMNMVKIIGEENGYRFTFNQTTDNKDNEYE